MQVLVIRHAIAEDRDRFAKTGRPDAHRPLTKLGRRRMRAGARGLARVVERVDVLATSTLTRAIQTGRIVGKVYPKAKTARIGQLSPAKPVQALMHWLQEQDGAGTVAVVGHEPQLGVFVSWALTGLQESFITLKKGAACLIEFDHAVKAGRAKLVWSLKPSQLRRLGARAGA